MERQLLEPLGALSAIDVVRRLCGVQAQVASSAELAIRLRQAKSSADEVRRALSDGRIVKTWAMRGTLHYLAADEAGDYLSLLAHGRSWERPIWERYFGLSPVQMEKLRDVVRDILDGRSLTREELIAEIIRKRGFGHVGESLRGSWGTAFKPLAWQGDIVFGPSQGTRITFARPEQISAQWRPVPKADDVAPDVFLRYLGAYGPASPQHFWRYVARGRLTRKQVQTWFDRIADRLTEVSVDAEKLFMRTEDVDDLARAKPHASVRFVSGFDQWVMGPGTEDPHIIPAGRRAAVSRTAGWISPVVVVGGVVSGTWQFDRDVVSVAWFSETGKPPSKSLEAEVKRLGSIVGRKLSLTVTQ
jgi:hypothetical protein